MFAPRNDSDELFGGDVPPPIRAMIDDARKAPRQSTAILWAAQGHSPECLPLYYLLYKAHASRGELTQAEVAARAGLDAASRQTGLPSCAALLTNPHTLPSDRDFSSPNAERFWLFTLKALAFVRIRQGGLDDARILLETVARLDPSHTVGSDVTLRLLAAAELSRTP